VIGRETLLSPDAFADALRTQRIDGMFLTVALFNQVANTRPEAFGGVRSLLVGGEKLLPEPVRRVLLSGAPPCALLNAYGPTETCVKRKLEISQTFTSSLMTSSPSSKTAMKSYLQ
jgi:non-ribosomal peptide synthetase component F